MLNSQKQKTKYQNTKNEKKWVPRGLGFKKYKNVCFWEGHRSYDGGATLRLKTRKKSSMSSKKKSQKK